ncbi:MAG: threonine synthase, partial [Candidatus Methylomirabilales bacterium]
MGKVTGLRCPRCTTGYPVEIEERRCERCRYILEVEVDLSGLHKGPELFLNRAERSIWRWREFLPIEKEGAVVTLGEGGTPLVPVERLRREVGGAEVYLKNDTVLPTGSLKDRSNAVAISRAIEEGRGVVAVASTGNAAASV